MCVYINRFCLHTKQSTWDSAQILSSKFKSASSSSHRELINISTEQLPTDVYFTELEDHEPFANF